MAIPLPNLDNRRFADLVREALARIPVLQPGWTDHNPSDPGITLVELFAWLTEAVVYRTNQIPDETYDVMLKLLGGAGWVGPQDKDLEQAIFETISALRTRDRAVLADDHEELVSRGFAGVARVECVPERCLDPYLGEAPAPGHVSVVVVPAEPDEPAPGQTVYDAPSAELLQAVRAYLHPRRLVTTRLHVVGPAYLVVGVKATLAPKPGFAPAGIAERAADALNRHYHPLEGGPSGEGWPFGRDVHVSEVHAVLDEVPGVDFVRELGISTDPLLQRSYYNGEGELTGARVYPHELVRMETSVLDFSVA